jgi:hypothetical protein
MDWVKGWEFRAWVVLPEMGQREEVGSGRHVGQNVAVARLGKPSSTPPHSRTHVKSRAGRLIGKAMATWEEIN